MELSPDQAQAMTALSARLSACGVDIAAGAAADREPGEAPAEVVAVLGKAGSGKTALLAELAGRLAASGLSAISAEYEPKRRRGRSFAVLAPTNKAASVLRGRGVPATTIHRVLYVPVYDPEFEKVAKWLTEPGAPQPESERLTPEQLERVKTAFAQHGSVPAALATAGVSGSDFIAGWTKREEALDVGLVDEASMLDDRLFDDLRSIFSLLILFGDPAQLAPVGQSGAMAFDALPAPAKLTLGRVHRQAEDNPILDLAHALQDESISFEAFERMVEDAAARDDRVVIAERADADLMARAPMLCWRNATRVRLISGFRSAHGLAEDRLSPGEPLICDGLELPMKHRRKRIDLEARGLVKGAQVIFLGEGRRGGFARLHVVGAEAPRINVAAIIKIEGPDREEPLITSAARMGAAFVHGAACTIHKAQGSQWPEVQVFAPDLFAAARSGRSEAGVALWRRLAYVAVTRAQERLVWVSRWRMSRPAQPLGAEDLLALAAAD
ncbi:exodeoxyribonuclease-5 [Rubrimonas cliftonensis]|uniref:Exodeoxyribonuclease-5 n=1 Tax=Rubrimonas cliftonensis TaxID=89524 RepID=A0A1H4F6P0_9RHOB|nr:exodeoxyribonuclease-5 [Rubrimonas cliftonensis]